MFSTTAKILAIYSEVLLEKYLDNSTIMTEIEYTKNDPNLMRVENVLERNPFPKRRKPIINPCKGDASKRSPLGGGCMSEEAFIKPNNSILKFEKLSFQEAGPRKHIAFDPNEVKAAIVTCGGLCPGLNVVLRELVMCMWFNYGVRNISGIKWGYHGFLEEDAWKEFTPSVVKEYHTLGGTMLGSSRGGFYADKIVDELERRGVNIVFAVGGDGTHRAIAKLSDEINRRGLKIGLAGIPKTIDNDIPLIDRTFGFITAVEEAVKVIEVADVEARGVKNGIGLVKIFGRSSGFIALMATIASRDINICLIPEAKFNLYGENGLIDYIFKRLKMRGHCVIIVAEGAGSAINDRKVEETGKFDKSGNPVLPDIGAILKEEVAAYSKKTNFECTLKYIDPTYVVRGVKANSYDTVLCTRLAQQAVHSVMSGFTNFTTGFIDRKPVLIPINYITNLGIRKLDPLSDYDYLNMMLSTGQPSFLPSTDEYGIRKM